MCVIFLNEWLESFDINVTDEKTVLQTSEPLESQPNLAQQQKSLLIHIWNSTKAPVFVLRVFLMRSWRMQWCNSELLSKLYIYTYITYIYIHICIHTHMFAVQTSMTLHLQLQHMWLSKYAGVKHVAVGTSILRLQYAASVLLGHCCMR